MHALEQIDWFIDRVNVKTENALRKNPKAEMSIEWHKIVYLGLFLSTCFISWGVH